MPMDPITKAFIIFIIPFGVVLAIFMRLDLVMHFIGRDDRTDELKRRQDAAARRDADAAESTSQKANSGIAPSTADAATTEKRDSR